MKKHKIIGVAIAFVIVTLTAITGFTWYKNNVFIGTKDVKAAAKTGNCKTFHVTVEQGAYDKFPTNGGGTYTAYAYAVKGRTKTKIWDEWEDFNAGNVKEVTTLPTWAERASDDMFLLKQETFTNSGTLDVSKEVNKFQNEHDTTNEYYDLIVEVFQSETVAEKGKEKGTGKEIDVPVTYICGSRDKVEIPNKGGTESDPNVGLCKSWADNNSSAMVEDGVNLNTPLEKIKDNAEALEEFRKMKQQLIGAYCSGGTSPNSRSKIIERMKGFEDEFMKLVDNMENSGWNSNQHSEEWLGMNKETDFENVAELPGVTIEGDNGGIKLETLYCKTNSVYLKDAEGANGVDKLEEPGTNQYALKYADREKKSVDTSDGKARANLYLFKYVAPTKEEKYNTFTVKNGEVVPSGEGTACTVDCTEYVKINFDPPQEVIAGMCFGYSIQVIAYTECSAQRAEFTVPDLPPTSSIRPRCHDGQSIGAGPNEEFEQCVMSCDGGKYTSECSDKCLDKINKAYGGEKISNDGVKKLNTGIKKFSSTSEKVLGTFIDDAQVDTSANICDSYPTIAQINQIKNTQGRDAALQHLRSWFVEHASGYYDYDGNDHTTIRFFTNCPGKYWSQYSPYYYVDNRGFETMTDHDMHLNQGRDTCHDNTHCEEQGPSCATTNDCGNKTGGLNGGGGFLVDIGADTSQDPNMTCDKNSETPYCAKLCETDCYYSNETGGDFVSASMISDAVDKTLSSYNDAWAKCNSNAACKSNGTTESIFYITVDENEDVDNYKWDETNDTGATLNPPTPQEGTHEDGCVGTGPGPDGDSSYNIIEGRDSTESLLLPGTGGLCYCGNTDYSGWHHYTRWTFPGTWINGKNNNVMYTPPSEDQKEYYTGGYNQYCVPEGAEDINTDWYKEFMKRKWLGKEEFERDGMKCVKLNYSDPVARTSINTSSIENNIKYKTEHFGNYDWTLKASCFYASSQTGETPFDDTTTEETPGSLEWCGPVENPASEYRVKSADLPNILPNAKGEGGTKETFNWSDAGTKLDIPGYEIVPGATRDYIEDLGDNIFKGTDYLDYEFNLNAEAMKDIASSNTTYGDFENYKDNGGSLKLTFEPIFPKNKLVDYSGYRLNAGKSGLISYVINKYGGHRIPLDQITCNNVTMNNDSDDDSPCQSFKKYYSDYVKWFDGNKDCKDNCTPFN